MQLSQKILDKTDGGRTIIEEFYETSVIGFNSNGKKPFEIRTESTASSYVKKLKDGTWIVTDFGDDRKGRNGIHVYMKEKGVDFVEAISALAKQLGLLEEFKPKSNVAYKNATKKEKPGTTYEFNIKLSNTELNILGPEVTQEICDTFNLKSCKKYTLITASKKEPNKLIKVVVESNEDYPIFVFDFPEFQKKYEPLNQDKGRRFTHSGSRPTNFVFGLENLRKLHQENKETVLDNWEKADKPTEKDFKLEAVILGSGERDSLNIASFDYPVIWLNSETDKLEWDTYIEILSITKNFYVLPDIDKTGIDKGVEKALDFPELKIIWLPKWLSFRKDFRGKARNDFRDFVQVSYYKGNEGTFKGLLKKMIKNALPMRFWDETWKKSRATDEWYCKYEFNNEYAMHFIEHQGFHLFESEQSKEDFDFIKVTGNVVQKVKGYQIKKHMHKFLEKKNHPVELRNMLHRTNQLSDKGLAQLNAFSPRFNKGYVDSQFFFFKDYTWRITKDEIKKFLPNQVSNYVWKNDIIDFEPKQQDPHFKITGNQKNGFDINVLNTENKYLNYLINGSRVFWKDELEKPYKTENGFKVEEKLKYQKENKFNIAGPNLIESQKWEQKQHLVNKIFTIGYLLHSYKDETKAWFPWLMDHELVDDMESNGGTGKSIFFKMLAPILNNVKKIDGRQRNVTEDSFLLDGVTSKTDLVLTEDMDAYFRLHRYLNFITDDMNVNPKGGTPYLIPYSESPKLAGSSNFGVNNIDGTLLRRLLFCSISDYYHEKGDRYNETRQVSDDFNGKRLLSDFTHQDWETYYNFCAQCVQFYLSRTEKLNPPLKDIEKRNLVRQMKTPFKNWADVYFIEEMLNIEIIKQTAYEDYKKETGHNKATSHGFKKSLKAWCKFMGFEFNPESHPLMKDGRIMQRLDGSKPLEHIFIKTDKTEKANNNVIYTESKAEGDDLPF